MRHVSHLLPCLLLAAVRVESLASLKKPRNHQERRKPLNENLELSQSPQMTTTSPNLLLMGEGGEESFLETNDVSRRAFLASMLMAWSATGIVTMASPNEAEATTGEESSNEILSDASVPWGGILGKASRKALGGGKAGASAAVVQVLSLMWLRTTMNYQYRFGGSLPDVLSKLWEQGGVGRFYQGLPFALVQGPLTRFGDTAANVGILALLDSLDSTRDLPLPLKTACGSIAAGTWRIFLMPVDTSKTAMQVEGREGLEKLLRKLEVEGISPLYQGALASATATAVGNFPWFLTYNSLNENLPPAPEGDLFLGLVRSAVLGLSASCVSDCCSNSLRVIKTTKQTASLNEEEQKQELSYVDVVKLVVEKDGVLGLLGRGLQTRLLVNMMQGAAFSVLWKYFQQMQ